jgi:hypothetical protein
MVLFSLEIIKIIKKMEKEDFNGIMDKYMTVNGKMEKNMAVDYGKQRIFLMLDSGKAIQFKDLVF